MSRLLIVILFYTLCGCEQTRSFLHLDSNSSSPFMGLELSVDRGESWKSDRQMKSVASERIVRVSRSSRKSIRDGDQGDRQEEVITLTLPVIDVPQN